MSLMEKRIETQERHRLVVNSFFWNEWALWKKGLRLTAQASKCACVSSGMNEPYGKKDWDIGNRCSYSMFKNRMNEPYGKKDWDEPLHCAKLQAYRLEWMSLMEKRIETFTVICDIDNDTDSWMNEPYGKKDWDHVEDCQPCTDSTLNEWALWKKGLRLLSVIMSLYNAILSNEWALWKKGLRPLIT